MVRAQAAPSYALAAMPEVGDDDQFEQDYLGKHDAIWASKGLKMAYEPDRATLDLGLHSYEPESTQPGSCKRVTRISDRRSCGTR